MDEILRALAESLAHAGPEWAFALGVVAILAGVAVKGLPVLADYKKGLLSIEERRESRKAEEARMRDEHDREMAQLNGKWLIVSEQSAKAMEGMTAQMQVLNTTLQDSKDRSRDMARQVADIHEAVVPRRREGGEHA